MTIKDNSDELKDGSGSGKVTFLAEQPDMNPYPVYASNLMNNSGTFTLESGLLENITDKKKGLRQQIRLIIILEHLTIQNLS